MARGQTGTRRSGPRSIQLTPNLLWKVFTRAFSGWWNDNVPRMGAALAYYTVFSLAPILIV